MNLAIYVVDDEFHALEILTRFIGRTPGLELAGSSTDPFAALNEIKALSPDLILLDIDMPGLSGLEMAKILAGRFAVILTTSHREFGAEAFELGVNGYLLKPVAYPSFLAGIEKVKEQLTAAISSQESGSDDFYVKTGTKGNFIRVIAKDIQFVKSDRNYVDIQLSDKVITAYLTLADITEILPSQHFQRVHRSYIANLNMVSAIEPGRIILASGIAIELGKTYKQDLMLKLDKRILFSSREREV